MGKVTTIFYAILGIPLMLLCLSNIGDIMASSFRFLYWRVCCFVCTREPKRSPSRRLRPGRGTIRQSGRQSIRKSERTISQKSRDSGFDPGLSHSYSDTELRYSTIDRGSANSRQGYGANVRHPRFNRDKDRIRDRHTVERERNVARELDDDEFGEIPPRASRYNTTGRINREPPAHHRGEQLRFHGGRGQSLDRKHNKRDVSDAETPVLCNKYAIDDMERGHAEVPPPDTSRGGHRRRMRERQPMGGPRSQSVPHPQYSNRLELPEISPPPSSRHKHFADDLDDFEEPELQIQAIRKAKRRDRAAPPSPRIMSPMGFAVHRQARYEEGGSLYDDDWDSYGDMPPRSRPVPIWLCVFLVISYIIAGAFLFSRWEPWTFLDSAYFCFITLTTIGKVLVDFVPATGVKANSEVSIALCSLYLLFGIALLAMSFNLVQEEVISNVKSVARRLGILKEEEIDD
uniref:Putative ion channel n=1 Tax=Lutzomyia longipalpis TaxID=7200 RepID=A0A1B0CED5_LUTLO